jgi:hypothetical protein
LTLPVGKKSPAAAWGWRRITVVILLAFVLLILAVQLLFLTNIPRNIVIAVAEKQSGLRITAQSLSTGFLGHTTLHDVTVALPSGGEMVLSIPTLQLDHSWVLGLLVGDSIVVHAISIDRPELNVRQEEGGTWNLEEMARVVSSASNASESGSGREILPDIQVKDATVSISDKQGRSTRIDRVNIRGKPKGSNWHVRIDAADQVGIAADVTPDGRWSHEVDFDIRDVRRWVSPWISGWPVSLEVRGKWDGRIASAGGITGQLYIDELAMRLRNGEVSGKGCIDTENPSKSRFDLAWNRLTADDLRPWIAAIGSAPGLVSGSLHVQPAQGSHPLEPLEVQVVARSEGIEYLGLEIGNITANGFLGPGRFVLLDTPDHPTQISLGGNVIDFWGRISRQPDGIDQLFVQIDPRNIELETLMPAGVKIARTPGLLNGAIILTGQPTHLDRIFGRGTLTLDQSDLAGTGPIAFLYELMHVGHDAKKPTGSGTIDFTIQNNNVYLSAVRYFDKGTEVYLSGEIDDITDLPHSPVSMVAVGSVRPLASIHLVGVEDIDDVMEAIQRSALAIRITGPLDKPTQKKIPLADVGQEMKGLLFGNMDKD